MALQKGFAVVFGLEEDGAGRRREVLAGRSSAWWSSEGEISYMTVRMHATSADTPARISTILPKPEPEPEDSCCCPPTMVRISCSAAAVMSAAVLA